MRSIQWYHCCKSKGDRMRWIYGNGYLYCEACGGRRCILDEKFNCSDSWNNNESIGTDFENVSSIFSQIVKIKKGDNWI